MPKAAFAVAAHPDDVEFVMAGTLLLLGQAGYELHYMTIANGSCGSASTGAEEIAATRRSSSEGGVAVAATTFAFGRCPCSLN